MRFYVSVLLTASLSSCGPGPKPVPAVDLKVSEAPKPADDSSRFPKANLLETKVIERQLLGKSFMPGGTLARYKKGKVEYEMFVARLPNPTEAAILLPDWRKALEGVKPIPTFGGYAGTDGGRPVFVFTKGSWFAGVAGLPQKDADMEARTLAARLN